MENEKKEGAKKGCGCRRSVKKEPACPEGVDVSKKEVEEDVTRLNPDEESMDSRG